MQATVVKTFPGVADGDVHHTNFAVGDTVTGSLAEVAVANGWARDNAAPVEAPAPQDKRNKRK